MKTVLIVHHKFSENTAGGIRHKYIIDYLYRQHNILIINDSVQKSTFFIKIKQFYHKIVNNFVLAPQTYSYIYKALKSVVLQTIEKKRIDAVLIMPAPFSLIRLISQIKRFDPNVRVIVDLSDPYCENAVLINKGKYYRFLSKRFEKFHFSQIDHLIVLNNRIKDYYDKICDNVTVIEQGIDERRIEFLQTPKTKDKIKNEIRLVYGGKFYKKFREPFALYDAVIRDRTYNIKLDIYSNMQDAKFYPPNDKNIAYRSEIEHEKLFQEYANSDIIVFIDNFFGMQVPGKTIELLALNKPILVIYHNNDSPTLDYLSPYDGVYYSKNDYNSILKSLHRIINSGLIDWKRDLSKYYWKNLLKKYDNIL